MMYIFDICNTLFDSNTTYDFISYYLKQNSDREKERVFDKITSRKSSYFWYLLILSKLRQIDLHKRAVVKLLEGESKSDLDLAAHRFYQDYLDNRKIACSFNIFQQAKAEDCKVVLISSTIDPVANAIGAALNVPVFSSELSYQNGLCIGEVKVDIAGEKEKLLPNFQISSGFTVITDNSSDYKLAEQAAKRFIVLYKEKNKKKWKDLNPIFLSPETC